jgi:hypothetical protein
MATATSPADLALRRDAIKDRLSAINRQVARLRVVTTLDASRRDPATVLALFAEREGLRAAVHRDREHRGQKFSDETRNEPPKARRPVRLRAQQSVG